MTPDRIGRGSFHVSGHDPRRALAAAGPGSAQAKKGAGKIRPNTVIISHFADQVNGKSGPVLQNLCSAQKQMCAFRKHSVLKS